MLLITNLESVLPAANRPELGLPLVANNILSAKGEDHGSNRAADWPALLNASRPSSDQC